MAILAILTVEESCIAQGARARFLLQIKNSGAAALNIQNVAVYTVPSAAPVGVGALTVPPQAITQVLASGSVYRSFEVTPYALLQQGTNPTAQLAVGVYAVVTMTDGTVATSDTVGLQVVPTTEPTTALPTAGQFDFTSNNNSGLWAGGWFSP